MGEAEQHGFGSVKSVAMAVAVAAAAALASAVARIVGCEAAAEGWREAQLEMALAAIHSATADWRLQKNKLMKTTVSLFYA